MINIWIWTCPNTKEMWGISIHLDMDGGQRFLMWQTQCHKPTIWWMKSPLFRCRCFSLCWCLKIVGQKNIWVCVKIGNHEINFKPLVNHWYPMWFLLRWPFFGIYPSLRQTHLQNRTPSAWPGSRCWKSKAETMFLFACKRTWISKYVKHFQANVNEILNHF